MSYRLVELGVILVLGWVVVWLTFPFEQDYDETLRAYSREPFMRVLLGMLLVGVSAYSVPTAILLFLIIFFWITDVHLISNINNSK